MNCVASGVHFLSSLLFRICRFFLFLLPAEVSHDLGLKGLGLLHKLGLSGLLRARARGVPVDCFGLHFANPVGLAAGLDKNADYVDALGALGFGFIEVGTITPKPQPGNPKPRLFRLAGQQAIINRMGFNNKGVAHLVARLQQRRYPGIVGVNIGKNLTTAVENAVDDYLYCLREVYTVADYVVVNLSSPNTPGLRSLQFGEQLEKLLATLVQERTRLAELHGRKVPLLLKIAPDLTAAEARSIAASVVQQGFDGIIATNTTIARNGVEGSRRATEAGGLSGAPVLGPSTEVLATVSAATGRKLPLIGVGGIMDGNGARQKLAAGASLVQVYSGFIYRGPALIDDCIAACSNRERSV
jgi:dihydroorotate dehydrogenase